MMIQSQRSLPQQLFVQLEQFEQPLSQVLQREVLLQQAIFRTSFLFVYYVIYRKSLTSIKQDIPSDLKKGKVFRF